KNLIDEHHHEEALTVLQDLEKSEFIQSWNERRFSNNVIFDSIMQDLARKCQEAKIKLEFEGIEPHRNNLTVLDKVNLFQNMTSNAFEANLKLSNTEERYIKIFSENRNHWTVLRIENPFNGELKIRNGKYLTTKN